MYNQAGSVKRPHRPTHLPDYAEACLQALADHGMGKKISLGGALGLLHYLDYRPTHDVGAWWDASATAEDQRQVIRLLETTLESFGQVKTRVWGDVVSVELLQQGRAVFSVQIARRSAQLEPSAPAPWTNVLLDSFPDLVASKMVALVERGAPRDFRDIHALCQAGLTTPHECWDLWRRRQRLADSDTDSARARLAIETHLARIAQHRPLARIADSQQRAEAEGVRSWFGEEFLPVCCQAGMHSNDVSDNFRIDGALYPDTEPPAALQGLADRVDFLARLCAAWDFGLLPDPDVVAEVRRAEWREAVDACRLLTSPTCHLLRRWHGLPPLPYLGQELAYIRDDPNLAHV